MFSHLKSSLQGLNIWEILFNGMVPFMRTHRWTQQHPFDPFLLTWINFNHIMDK